jgi:hypothetical protein
MPVHSSGLVPIASERRSAISAEMPLLPYARQAGAGDFQMPGCCSNGNVAKVVSQNFPGVRRIVHAHTKLKEIIA